MDFPIHVDTISMNLSNLHFKGSQFDISKFDIFLSLKIVFMPPKELWEAYSNRTVRPPRFLSGAYLLYSLR